MKNLEKMIAKCEANSVPDSAIDYSDIPPLTDEQLSQMKPCHLVNREMWKPMKKTVSIRLDADILEAFKSTGKGYQTRINDALREVVVSGKI